MPVIPQYRHKILTDIYSSAAEFVNDYKNVGIPVIIADSSVSTLYYLLYAKYGNTPIANDDVNQFKYKVFSIIWQFGPTWEKKVEIQKKLHDISEEDLLSGSINIVNQSMNPSTEPTSGQFETLDTINNQTASKTKRSKMEAYATLTALLLDDVTEPFLERFAPLFNPFVSPIRQTLYYDEGVIYDESN